MSCIYISIVLNIYTHRASHIYPPYSSYTSIDAYLIISDGLFEHILLFIGRFLLFVLLLFALLCVINCQSNVYMKNKILLLGLFCCSLISAKAQVLLDKEPERIVSLLFLHQRMRSFVLMEKMQL